MARRGDWVPCRGYGVNFSLTDVDPTRNILLVRHGYEIDPLSSSAAIVEETDDILTQRVVGQVRVASGSEDAALVALRIRVGLYDDSTDTAAFYADSLYSAAGAEEPFLWQRYIQLTPGGDTLDVFSHPMWSMIDARVARRLGRDQALFLSLQKGTSNTSLLATPYLRTWARGTS